MMFDLTCLVLAVCCKRCRASAMQISTATWDAGFKREQKADTVDARINLYKLGHTLMCTHAHRHHLLSCFQRTTPVRCTHTHTSIFLPVMHSHCSQTAVWLQYTVCVCVCVCVRAKISRHGQAT